MSAENPLTSGSTQAITTYRHRLPVRIMHWVNFLALAMLLTSGLQIFNAHPRLYWGKSSYTGRPPILSMEARPTADGNTMGVTRVFGHDFDTTGVFGLSKVEGRWLQRGFPAWATLPGPQWLAMGRRWHFFFAWIFVLNGLTYVAYSVASRHIARDLAPKRAELRGIGRSLKDHLLFRHPRGMEASRYNVLQKLTYLVVIFGLSPMIVVMGLGLSPRLDSLLPGWADSLGGRQSVRTLHFAAAAGLVGFFVIHIFQVLVTGVWNNLRSMITGRYRIQP